MLLLIGFLFMVLIFACVGVLSETLPFLIDLPSVLLILLPLVFFLAVSKSGSIIGKYIRMSFKKNPVWTQAELARLSAAVRGVIKFIHAIGGFGFLAGLIGCLAHIESLQRLGPNLAISLVTLTYSITTSCFVFLPVQAWAENKMNALKGEE